MTAKKNLKRLIRKRMEETGERYTDARRHVLWEQKQKSRKKAEEGK